MNQPPILIKAIKQIDNHTFCIEWSDGESARYKLSHLQKNCPCAQCQHVAPKLIEDVRALNITNVGRYALRIKFTSGCSSGIYSFAKLREMAKGAAI